jgi:hypothetical protein
VLLQRAVSDTFVLEKNFTRFLCILLLLFNELTESFELAQACIAHELEGDAFACLDKNASGSQPLESKWNFKRVAGRDTICDDVSFEFTLYEGESCLEDANVGLRMEMFA